MKDEREEERKATAPPLGIAVRAAQAPGGMGPFARLVKSLNPAFLLGTKTGTLALILACTSGAAGLSYLLGNRGGLAGAPSNARPFDSGSAEASALAAAAKAAAASLPGSSLEYFVRANGVGETSPSQGEEGSGQDPAAGAEAPPDPPAPSVEAASSAKMDVPKLTAGKSAPQPPGGDSPTFSRMPTASDKIGAGFQGVYRPQGASLAPAQGRPSYGANRRSSVLSANGGSLAQARAIAKTGNRAALANGEPSAGFMTQGWDASGVHGSNASAIDSSNLPKDLKGPSQAGNALSDTENIQLNPPDPGEGKEQPEKKNNMLLILMLMMALMLVLVLAMGGGC